MVEFHLLPPGAFDFKNPDDWSRWKLRFQQFRVASGLNDQSESKQVSMLLYSLGEEAEAVLLSTNIKPSERESYILLKSLRNSTGTFKSDTTSFSSGRGSIEKISQKESPVTNISRSCTNWLIDVHTNH